VAETQSFSFERDPESVPAARAALDRFEGRVPPEQLYDASLCLSELVTNAVQHPDASEREPIELAVAVTEEKLRVEVIDPGSGFAPTEVTQGDERGWGLFIVDQLSSRWGVSPGDRTAVWFEIALRSAA
jgi:serine/threonine-protein kinase RsbW